MTPLSRCPRCPTATQLFSWSPTTFHTAWNATNCAVYVLRRDRAPGASMPYRLDTAEGDKVESSLQVGVTLSDGSTRQVGEPPES
jgi:hypothetical protein